MMVLSCVLVFVCVGCVKCRMVLCNDWLHCGAVELCRSNSVKGGLILRCCTFIL